ncbi:MAG: antitoxin [Candidatus Rokuibacteriota bacterium]
MRTTLNLDEDVLAAARSLARSRGRSLGRVVSELARLGLRPQLSKVRERGFPVFDLAPDTPPLTPEMVRRALDDAE